jgi:hypothetical protein
MADMNRLMEKWQRYGFAVEFCTWCRPRRQRLSNAMVHYARCPLKDIQLVRIPVDFDTPVDVQAQRMREEESK